MQLDRLKKGYATENAYWQVWQMAYMKQGYIKLDRRILEWRYHDYPNMFGFWILLLLKANWKPAYFKGILVPRGSLITSARNLAKESYLSVNTVRRLLKLLEEEHQITRTVTQSWTQINIVNYSKFQDFEEVDDTLYDTQFDTPTDTPTDTLTDTLTAHNRINKEYKEYKKYINTCPEQTSLASEPNTGLPALILKDGSRFHISQNHFNEFVNAYPGVDIRDQILKMSQWLKTNPTKRKTKNGIMRFINSWISRSEREMMTAKHSSTKISMPEYIRQQEAGTLPEGTPASKELLERLQKMQKEGI